MLPSRAELSRRLQDLQKHANRWSTCPAQAVGAEDLWSGVRAVNGAPSSFENCFTAGCAWVPSGTAGSGRDHARHLHAEAALVASFARRGTSLENRDILITKAPCPSCALLLIACGVHSVVVPMHAIPEGWEIIRAQLNRAGVSVLIV